MERTTRALALALLAALAAAGCRSAQSWRAEADRAAADALAAARRAEGVRDEALEIESPSDTLRRRLLVAQDLPVFDPASLGIRDLPTNRYWRAEERLLPGREGGDAAFAPSGTNALEIGLQDAVRIAAANSPEFRADKERLFAAALALDLESDAFHTTLLGALSAAADTSRDETGKRTGTHGEEAKPSLRRTFENGVSTDASLAFNLAGSLTGSRRTAWGAVADLSVSIPLLRGSGSLVRRESLTQAERDLVYAVREFEQRKRAFAVEISRAYLSLLLAVRTRRNEDDNYRRVVHSTDRSRRMADASRMSKAAFAQSYQSELAARASWIAACQGYESALDSFKTKLGLPPDARIAPREADLDDLAAFARAVFDSPDPPDPGPAGSQTPGPGDRPASVDEGEMKEATDRALETAFANRTDVLSARERVEDAQRRLLVAEDALRNEITIGGSARAGQAATAATAAAGESHAPFRLRDATGVANVSIDLALHRTSERNAYRSALVSLESAVRDYQRAEDGLKTTVREDMRALSQSREQVSIQRRAVELAASRVRNQDLLLEAGRADMTDVLDAQAALVGAQNALDRALIDWRGQLLALQRDLGTLDATVDGVWTETDLAALGIPGNPR